MERQNEKKPMASGFTPEHELGERYVLHKKKKEQQKLLKNLLSSQIDQKKSMQEKELKDKHEYENQLYEQNAVNMEAIKEQKKNDKMRA